ncbi:hypothetical protein U91I_01687 [alpha proteobacterium U9-1i]|nr:hypothetical protein U91I_01687 [alpha proteobacterium U9-1i]
MRLIASLFLFAAVACTPQAAPADLGPIAESYVRLTLEMDTHEEGYVDAYYGDPAWREDARANPRSIADLKTAADALLAQIEAGPQAPSDAASARRAEYLRTALVSARFRLDMMEGARIPFADEAERLFGLRPVLHPLESYDAVLARIDALAPGPGPLAERVAAFRARYVVPPARRQAVMEAAIAECRRRTMAHLELPANESFTLEFVSDKSWGAYNWYHGENRSVIQVNTDLPTYINSAIGYGCHEGYPGHHVQNIYAERAYREQGMVEFSVLPLYAPTAPLNEGGGNYGEELAFPGDERMIFERDVLYPLAGIDPSGAVAYREFQAAASELAGAARTIDAMYLDGQIDRARAVELRMRYTLNSRGHAEQSLDFADQYRSYVINYSSGLELVRDYVERTAQSPDERWAIYARLFSEPTVPAELQAN